MKHVFSVLSVASVILMTIFLSTSTGCKKGDDGAKGDTGTANVMFSSWKSVTFNPEKNTDGDTVAWTAVMPAPQITKGIIDSGLVKVYMNAGTSDNPYVVACPFTDYYGYFFVQNLNVYFTVGNINMYATEDAGTITTSGQTAYQFRYVIIPGGVAINGRSAVNWDNYEAIKRLYNIPN